MKWIVQLDRLDSYTRTVFSGIEKLPMTPDRPQMQVRRICGDVRSTLIVLLLLTPIYGIVMGSYAAATGERFWLLQIQQMLYSAIKMPLLVVGTTVLSVPSFWVFNTIAGLREDLVYALRAIWWSLASFAITLASLIPLVLLFYVSLPATQHAYRLAVMLNALVFAVAAAVSQWVLLRSYQKLFVKSKSHRMMLVAWCLTFAFVGVQLGWSLRPFIGNPSKETTFFRDQAVGNAYLEVWRIVKSIAFEIRR